MTDQIELPPPGSRWKNSSGREVTVRDVVSKRRERVVRYVYDPSQRAQTSKDPIGQPLQELNLEAWLRIFSTRVE